MWRSPTLNMEKTLLFDIYHMRHKRPAATVTDIPQLTGNKASNKLVFIILYQSTPTHHDLNILNVTMETTPLLHHRYYGNKCSSLSGFFLLMTIVTVVFNILVTIFPKRPIEQ